MQQGGLVGAALGSPHACGGIGPVTSSHAWLEKCDHLISLARLAKIDTIYSILFYSLSLEGCKSSLSLPRPHPLGQRAFASKMGPS